jgi:SAP domain
MRPSPEAKRCLSQKPRSAISKSARKRRRESSTVQRTVLFADTAGEDIELASGPHYSPVPKPRGSPRRSGVAAFDDDVVGVSDGDAAMPPTFVNALPRPSPGTRAGPVERDVVPAPADSCSRALGPPPSTPLGRLGWFFYPTRPAVPLLTDGSPSRPDVANDSDAGAVLEPSLADESSGSSDGAAAPILLPFTESGAPAESHSPPRRRSLLGGLASLGSYAAGSVLRRFSGAQPRVSLDGTDTADDSGDLEGAADAHSSADAVRGAASDPACAAKWTGGENSAGAAEAEDKGDSVEGSRYPLDKTVPGKNEAVDPCDNTDEEDEEEADGRFAVEARGGRPGHLEPEAEDVDVKSPPRPRRQSFLGRAYSAVFSGSGRRQDECLVQVHEPAPQGSSPAPVECENDPAVVGEHAAREVNSDGGGEVCDRTGHSDRSSSSASQETDFTSWTVKELREYLSGLGRACNGMRKAALVGLATELSRSDAADVPTHAAERNSLSPAIRTGGDSGEGTHGLSGHTVLELRKILADLGMETTGRKAELVRRLEAPLSGLVGKDGRAFADNEDGNERAEVGDGEAEALAASSSGKASASYSALPVRGLRELLEQRGLSATGRKQVLLDRLSADDMASDAAAPEPTVDDTGAVGLDALTVAGLRVQLGALGLSTAGKKGELKTRLAEALARDRGAVVLVDGDAAAKALVWKTADPSRMTVVQLRNALLENAMCGFGNKARLVQKVNALRAGERAASRLRGRDDLTICPACEKGEACKASV